jgi:hypothetical protein
LGEFLPKPDPLLAAEKNDSGIETALRSINISSRKLVLEKEGCFVSSNVRLLPRRQEASQRVGSLGISVVRQDMRVLGGLSPPNTLISCPISWRFPKSQRVLCLN